MESKSQYASLKITKIQYICAILVVILHSSNIKTFALSGEFKNIEILFNTVGNMAVPTFFLFSAFLFFKGFCLKEYVLKLKKRFKTLLIPYLLWNLIGFLFFYILTNAPIIGSYMNQDTVDFVPIKIIRDIILSKYTPLWFVKNLLVYFVLSPIIYVFVRNKIVAIISILSIVVADLYFGYVYESVLTWLPIILFGAYVAIHHYTKLLYWEKLKVDVQIEFIVYVITILLIVLTAISTILNNDGSIYIYLLRLISPIFMWFIFDRINWDNDVKWWQKISFFIYCSHFYFVSIYQKIMHILFGNSLGNAIFVYLTTPIVTIVIVTFIAWFMQKYLIGLWKVLTGGR